MKMCPAGPSTAMGMYYEISSANTENWFQTLPQPHGALNTETWLLWKSHQYHNVWIDPEVPFTWLCRSCFSLFLSEVLSQNPKGVQMPGGRMLFENAQLYGTLLLKSCCKNVLTRLFSKLKSAFEKGMFFKTQEQSQSTVIILAYIHHNLPPSIGISYCFSEWRNRIYVTFCYPPHYSFTICSMW